MNRYAINKRNEQMWHLYKDGKSVKWIAETFGLAPRTVYYIIHKYMHLLPETIEKETNEL